MWLGELCWEQSYLLRLEKVERQLEIQGSIGLNLASVGVAPHSVIGQHLQHKWCYEKLCNTAVEQRQLKQSATMHISTSAAL